ncbi:MAG: hypothetical protein K1X55_04730 [Chitinophagales bacterium]|nr:hypothetical protein [Chitinophagales bacterium]
MKKILYSIIFCLLFAANASAQRWVAMHDWILNYPSSFENQYFSGNSRFKVEVELSFEHIPNDCSGNALSNVTPSSIPNKTYILYFTKVRGANSGLHCRTETSNPFLDKLPNGEFWRSELDSDPFCMDNVALLNLTLRFTCKNPVNIKDSAPSLPLGDHIKKRRLALAMTYTQLSTTLGSTVECVKKWEQNLTIPRLFYYHTIIIFLGYLPFHKGQFTFGQQITYARIIAGISLVKLAKDTGIGKHLLIQMEADEQKGTPAQRQILSTFIEKQFGVFESKPRG